MGIITGIGSVTRGDQLDMLSKVIKSMCFSVLCLVGISSCASTQPEVSSSALAASYAQLQARERDTLEEITSMISHVEERQQVDSYLIEWISLQENRVALKGKPSGSAALWSAKVLEVERRIGRLVSSDGIEMLKPYFDRLARIVRERYVVGQELAEVMREERESMHMELSK